jgi:diguanylate cyclase (GGDEF)-like protein
VENEMFCKQKHDIITETDLQILNKFVSAPLILLNCENIAFMNSSCSLLFGYNDFDMQKLLKTSDFFIDDKFIIELDKILNSDENIELANTYMMTARQEKIYINLEYKVVCYKSKKYIFTHLHDVTEKLIAQSKLIKASMIRDLMLDISQSIVKIKDINQIYNLILENAIKALEKARIGTIFIKKDGVYKVEAYVGFSKEIADFQLRPEETFLYRATDGKMDTIANISDLMSLNDTKHNHYSIKTIYGERFIESCMVAPININGEVCGMLSIDSIEVNAFDDDDIKYMEFMKNSIETAISNFLQYEERTYLSNHDSLTKLYNRVYIEEIFDKFKEEALKDNSSFYMVMFDIDNLKLINDSHGHSEGDTVIIKISDELRELAGEKDVLARIGGDEFLGIFHDKDMDTLFNRIKNSIINMSSSYSFSFGMSSFGEDGLEFKELFKKADERMYSIKNHRENVDNEL